MTIASNLYKTGDGRHGDVVVSSDSSLNTYYAISSIASDNKTITIGGSKLGTIGALSVGDEVMLYVTEDPTTTYIGKFDFFTVTSVNGSTIVLNKPCDSVIPYSLLSSTRVTQLIKVPNYNNLTINANINVIPPVYDSGSGGLVVFRVKNAFNLQGRILTSSKGYQNGNQSHPHKGKSANEVPGFSSDDYNGGGGGSLRYAGGDGGDDTSGTKRVGGDGGAPLTLIDVDSEKRIYFGGYGGRGASSGTVEDVTYGGSSSGAVFIIAQSTIIGSNGTIESNGGGGRNNRGSSYGGSGGGAGGTIVIYSDTITGFRNYAFGVTGGGGAGAQTTGMNGGSGTNTAGGTGGAGYNGSTALSSTYANGGGGGGDQGTATGQAATSTKGGKGGFGNNVAGGGGGGAGYIFLYTNSTVTGNYQSTPITYTLKPSFIVIPTIDLPFPNQTKRKENLEYLRTMINKFRTDNGLSAKTWTDPIIVSDYTPIKAIHWNEMNDSILEVYDLIGEDFINQMVKKQLRDVIKPKDTGFSISDLTNRIDGISKGLRNV